jgi:hypothetical protein
LYEYKIIRGKSRKNREFGGNKRKTCARKKEEGK